MSSPGEIAIFFFFFFWKCPPEGSQVTSGVVSILAGDVDFFFPFCIFCVPGDKNDSLLLEGPIIWGGIYRVFQPFYGYSYILKIMPMSKEVIPRQRESKLARASLFSKILCSSQNMGW